MNNRILGTIVYSKKQAKSLVAKKLINERFGEHVYNYPCIIYYGRENGDVYSGFDYPESACMYSEPKDYKHKQLVNENVVGGKLL